jgi:hypothetical protein
VRDNFIYARTFLNDADLDEQRGRWIEKANGRIHGTTKEVPRVRFEAEERHLLRPVAERPYRSLVLLPGLQMEPVRSALPVCRSSGAHLPPMRRWSEVGMKAVPSRRDRLRSMLADLKMPGALEALDGILHGIGNGALTAAEAVESLHELGFLERKENTILVGPSGVGKTHIAISLAIAAAQSGHRVYYSTLADLITGLEEAQAAGKLLQRMKVLTHSALLVVDEIGYLPVTRTGATLFFQMIARRYERASTVLTPNKSFEEWGEIFSDEVMAAALIAGPCTTATFSRSAATATGCAITPSCGTSSRASRHRPQPRREVDRRPPGRNRRTEARHLSSNPDIFSRRRDPYREAT